MLKKKGTLTGLGISALAVIIFAQQIKEQALVINIEVPVRIYKGNRFIDNLTIDDFEVYEDGNLQKIEAVYLAREGQIQKEKARRPSRLKLRKDTSSWFSK